MEAQKILITSRFSDWASWADEIRLDALSSEEAASFLRQRAERPDDLRAKSLAEALGNLPLALDHAATYCRRTGTTFGDYTSRATTLMNAVPRGASYPRSISATFNLAIEAAAEEAPAVEQVMAYLSLCAPAHIPIVLVRGAFEDEFVFSGALNALTEASLIQQTERYGIATITVHPVVHAVAMDRVERREEVDIVTDTLISALMETFARNGTFDSNEHTIVLLSLPHADNIVNKRNFTRCPLKWADMIEQMAFVDCTDTAGFERYYNYVLELRQNELGFDHSVVAYTLRAFGIVLRETAEHRDRGCELLTRALNIYEALPESQTFVIAALKSDIARALFYQNKFTESPAHIDRYLTFTKSQLG
jgi:hypothetical protein